MIGIKVCITYDADNKDPRLTFSYFTTRSNFVSCAFEWGTVKMSFNGGKLRTYDQNDRIFMYTKKF